MAIGARIKELRTQKNLSQGDIEAKTGLLRCYISRVENGHTVPSIETLERFASAFDVPLYRLFYFDQAIAGPLAATVERQMEELARGAGKDDPEVRFLMKLKEISSHLSEADRDVLLTLAQKLAHH